MNTTIDTTKPGFSLRNALACAYAAKLAYTEPSTIRDFVTDTNVLILDQPEAVLVAFAGTKSLRNVLTDLKVRRVPLRVANWETEVHHGFLAAHDSVKDAIAAALAKFDPAKPVIRVGHSLGGALATLDRARTASAYASWAFTFGEPRGGNKSYAGACDELFGARHFRMENDIDSITRVPGWLLGNRHSGQNYFFDAWGDLDVNPTRWFKALSDLWHVYRVWDVRTAGPQQIMLLEQDHHIDHYQAYLANAVVRYPNL